MINEAFTNIPPASNSYAQYLGSIVGKPLALVNMGWSLELATDAYKNQSTKDMLPPVLPLLPPQTKPVISSLKPPANTSTPGDVIPPNYMPNIKLGDKDRVYDGLVGFWKYSADAPGSFDLSYSHTSPPSCPITPP